MLENPYLLPTYFLNLNIIDPDSVPKPNKHDSWKSLSRKLVWTWIGLSIQCVTSLPLYHVDF